MDEHQTIKIMDTTLRDGEQTTGVAFNASEKLSIAQILLKELKVDYIEVASARVSDGEMEGTKRITTWARKNNFLDKVEVLGFVDHGVSIDWVERAGCKTINLLLKGSLKHVTEQLKKSPKEHLADARKNIEMAQKRGLTVNVYLEDWSNGMIHSKTYVHSMIQGLSDLNIGRIMLPDTLGILNPDNTLLFVQEIVDSYPNIDFDFHAHNDYDLALGNTYKALIGGIGCVHTTINGLGERAGNAPLSSVIAMIKDQLNKTTSINERKINMASRLVESFSGIHIPTNKPVIGEFVFTQCSGIHADGDNKDNLYFNDLLPERFGRERQYALGKTSGKANIKNNLESIGISLDGEDLRKVTDRIIELADKKETVTIDELPYIVSDVLKSEELEENIIIMNYSISLSKGLSPMASVLVEINNEIHEGSSRGDGQYDAFMNAIKQIYFKLNKPFPTLLDYKVAIPPGGKTDALVETVITWKLGKEFRTRGLDPDQTSAAIKATEKMLNFIE